jgi:hypothetical protein
MARKPHLVAMTDETLERYGDQLHAEIVAVLTEIALREDLKTLDDHPIGDTQITELDRLF